MDDDFIKDGYLRRVYHDAVHWLLYPRPRGGPDIYFVARFPFVPDYHLCELIVQDGTLFATERPLQHFKTLTQALAVLKVIEGSKHV
jgi:hypothetical protein